MLIFSPESGLRFPDSGAVSPSTHPPLSPREDKTRVCRENPQFICGVLFPPKFKFDIRRSKFTV